MKDTQIYFNYSIILIVLFNTNYRKNIILIEKNVHIRFFYIK